MLKFFTSNLLTIILLMASLTISNAQQLDVPISGNNDNGQAADCAASFVAGLKADGDGFLAVRSGPGSDFKKIGELYNGDVVLTCDTSGKWIGVFYGRVNINNPSSLEGDWNTPFTGWVHSNWLRALAG